MTNISLAGVGMYTFMLVSLLRMLNIEITETDAEQFIVSIVTVATFLMWVWGQLRRSDLVLGLWRRYTE